MPQGKENAPAFMVVLAFATVYIVWGSTYYFIQRALSGFPALILGAFRFIAAGILLMGWSIIRGERIFVKADMIRSAITGLLLLFIANGIVIWVEQTVPSAMVAILVSSSPLWFVLLDKPNWSNTLHNTTTIAALIIGFIGVLVLFWQPLMHAFSAMGTSTEITGLFLLTIGVIAWSGGSLYSKYNKVTGSGTVNTAWQMIFAGIAFIPGVAIRGEWTMMNWQAISGEAWLAVTYLIFMGSIAAYSAYVWLLQVRPATQVSTYAYVNPVVAVGFGILLANEKISAGQIIGLAIILGSVLMVNISAYRKKMQASD